MISSRRLAALGVAVLAFAAAAVDAAAATEDPPASQVQAAFVDPTSTAVQPADPTSGPTIDRATLQESAVEQTVISEQAQNVVQDAGASAAAVQDQPENSNVVVRTSVPGDNGAVAEANASDATATAENAQENRQEVVGPGNAGQQASDTQSAVAAAASVQTKPSNVNVSVRIDSIGNDGPVVQTNDATASGKAANASVGVDTGSSTVEATAVALQEQPSNTNVSVRVLSPGDNGPVTQVNNVTAEARATAGSEVAPTSAEATQLGPANTNVSIRVLSPGADDTVVQLNQVDAGSGGNQPGALAVETQTDPRNTSVSIVVGNPNVQGPVPTVPTAEETWVWNWKWTWKPGAEPPPSIESWAWNWAEPDPSVVQTGADQGVAPAADVAPAAEQGFWIWTWKWTRTSDGTSLWQWEWKRSCLCNWVWNWTWNWDDAGQPSAAVSVVDGTPGELSTGAPVSQQNVAAADAVAANTSAHLQQATQLAGQTQAIVQTVSEHQLASAAAVAEQTGAVNTNVVIELSVSLDPLAQAGGTGEVGIDQVNRAQATGLASNERTSEQIADQSAAGSALQNETVTQTSEAYQAATASALATQTDVVNANETSRSDSPGPEGQVSQQNVATADATSSNATSEVQDSRQSQTTGGSLTYQVASSTAAAAQDGTENSNSSVRTASPGANGHVTQSNVVSASAPASNAHSTNQSVDQYDIVSGSSSVVQPVTIEQYAAAAATDTQSGVSNKNSWESWLGAVDAPSVTQEHFSVSIANADHTSEASQSAEDSQWAVAPVTEHLSALSDGEGPLPLSVAAAGSSVPGSPGIGALLTGSSWVPEAVPVRGETGHTGTPQAAEAKNLPGSGSIVVANQPLAGSAEARLASAFWNAECGQQTSGPRAGSGGAGGHLDRPAPLEAQADRRVASYDSVLGTGIDEQDGGTFADVLRKVVPSPIVVDGQDGWTPLMLLIFLAVALNAVLLGRWRARAWE
jgi:hypothetical protein